MKAQEQPFDEDNLSYNGSFNDDDLETTGENSRQDDSDESRDEVKEVENATRSETVRLRLWRVVVTVVLLLTALAVTLTTYSLLKREQKERFETAVSQVSVFSN